MSIVIEEMNGFNASIAVTELLTKTLENCAKDLATRCIKECASRHGFDADEEIRILGLENLVLIRKQMAKKSVSKEKKERVVQVKEKKSSFPLPFSSSRVIVSGCQGLAYNRGLFTQCTKKKMENGSFCSGCQSEADKNASGCPDCGTVEQRMASGLYEFKDPKGRSPVSYAKVLDKLKLSAEAAMEEAGKLGRMLELEHFQVAEKVKVKKVGKGRGRPTKSVGVIEAENVTDLFAKLTAEGNEEVTEDVENEPVKVSKKKVKLSEEEKAAKKAALEEERALKKAEREEKLAAEKAEREEKRKAEAEQKKADREAKVAAEKAERESKRATEKAEREAKKAAEKGTKSKKSSKSSKKEDAGEENDAEEAVAAPVVTAPAVAAEKTKVTVSRIQIGGVTYLKSSNNILYDPDSKEEVAMWDPVGKKIVDLPEEDEEEEEEGYESG